MSKWIKVDSKKFPEGKCLILCLSPFFGCYTSEIEVGFYDDPSDYEGEGGKGWCTWDGEHPRIVTHYMELPKIPKSKYEGIKQKDLDRSKINLGNLI